MLRLTGLVLPIEHTDEALVASLCKKVGIDLKQLKDYKIFRRSIDARKKPVVFNYTIDFEVYSNSKRLIKPPHVMEAPLFEFKPIEGVELGRRPVVIGLGPAGLFASYYLAMQGHKPIVIERGEAVEERQKTVDLFWQKGILSDESNVQFGEGGAGAFSDGKLTTRIKDPLARYVFEVLVAHGAPDRILIDQKPHVGTDLLIHVVKSMREKIVQWGGEVYFNERLESIECIGNQISHIKTSKRRLEAKAVFLGIGHSARDTYRMLHRCGLEMTQKPFAMGLRIEHPREMIDRCQYGNQAEHPRLGAADYAVKAQGANRNVYSFCMCPGGHVINASSVKNHLVVNGMSYHARDAKNSNSALLVTINPSDFESAHPLAGLKYQEDLEALAFQSAICDSTGSLKLPYSAPVQLLGDFLQGQVTTQLGDVKPSVTPGYHFVDFNEWLPTYMSSAIKEALPVMGRQLKGFDRKDAVLTGVESRSSSPVRILRDDRGESSNVKGVFPMGEGAGYAGGITSAAVDGLNAVHQYLMQHVKQIK